MLVRGSKTVSWFSFVCDTGSGNNFQPPPHTGSIPRFSGAANTIRCTCQQGWWSLANQVWTVKTIQSIFLSWSDQDYLNQHNWCNKSMMTQLESQHSVTCSDILRSYNLKLGQSPGQGQGSGQGIYCSRTIHVRTRAILQQDNQHQDKAYHVEPATAMKLNYFHLEPVIIIARV